MTRRAVIRLLALVGLLTGCGDDGSTTAVRGLGRGRGAASVTAQEDLTSSPVLPGELESPRRTEPIGGSARPVPHEAAPPVPSPARTDPTKERERDLSGELATRMGNPGACLNGAGSEDLRDAFHVRVSATVTPTGIVTGASATGPGLTDAMRRCVERRATGVGLEGPIPDAPRSVSAEFEVKRSPD